MLDNTVIVFTSDNGRFQGSAGPNQLSVLAEVRRSTRRHAQPHRAAQGRSPIRLVSWLNERLQVASVAIAYASFSPGGTAPAAFDTTGLCMTESSANCRRASPSQEKAPLPNSIPLCARRGVGSDLDSHRGQLHNSLGRSSSDGSPGVLLGRVQRLFATTGKAGLLPDLDPRPTSQTMDAAHVAPRKPHR